MDYRTLGRTGLKVSEVGFGAWAIGGPAKLGMREIGWGQTNDSESLRALKAAFDAGINFFDTADAYGNGHSEELLGKAFSSERDKIIITSKGGNRTINGEWVKDFSSQWIEKAVEGSLGRLRTDYIDVYLLHSPRSPEQFQQATQSFDLLDKLKDAGKIRSWGISILPVKDGLTMIETGRGEVIQVVYNILIREPERKLLPLATEHNIGIIARVPLASGFLTGKYTRDTHFPPDDHRSNSLSREWIEKAVAGIERLGFLTEDKDKTLAQAALQFVLSHPAVSVTIPGAKNPTQAVDNAGASDGLLLSQEELRRIRELVSSLDATLIK